MLCMPRDRGLRAFPYSGYLLDRTIGERDLTDTHVTVMMPTQDRRVGDRDTIPPRRLVSCVPSWLAGTVTDQPSRVRIPSRPFTRFARSRARLTHARFVAGASRRLPEGPAVPPRSRGSRRALRSFELHRAHSFVPFAFDLDRRPAERGSVGIARFRAHPDGSRTRIDANTTSARRISSICGCVPISR